MTNIYGLPALSALLTIVVAVCTVWYKRPIRSPNPLYANDSIMAFEFARTAQQIRSLFVDQAQQPSILFIQKVRFLTWLDFLFILFYTLFTVSFAWGALQVMPSIWTYIALLIAPLISVFDVLENIQLFQILSAVETNVNATFQPALRRLSIFTWTKWLGTGLLMVLLIPFLWQQPTCWPKGLAVLTVGVFILGIIALRERIITNTSIAQARRFSGAILITFALFALYAMVSYFSLPRQPLFNAIKFRLL